MIEGPYQSKQDIMAKRIVLFLFIAFIVAVIAGASNSFMDRAYKRGQQDMLHELADVVQYNKELICNY